jgi:diacylglycerol O-acyltransferase / wax synthase
MGRHQSIDRVGADDVMSLVSDRDDPPLQVGVMLLLDVRKGLDPVRLKELLRHRLAAVPRLRQRLINVPVGCGRPVWVDYPEFRIEDHFAAVLRAAPTDEEAVLSIAADLLTTRLPRDRPLWAARLVTGVGHHQAALLVVFHHVLADGVAGLTLLASLVDGVVATADFGFPRPAPSVAGLALDAVRDRFRSLVRLPAAATRLGAAFTELGPALRTRAVPCSLNRPTGPRRQFLIVRSDLSPILDLAHENAATVNDLLLSAITNALHRLLAERGEQLPTLVVSIPVSSRGQANVHELGNRSGVVPLLLPATGAFPARLAAIASITRAAKSHQRGASTAVLGPVFRLLAKLGLYQRFINHQRRIHTFVSNIKGPSAPLTLLGCPITDLVPLSVAPGNVTVSFTVLSYNRSLVITIAADPDTCPDLDHLHQELQHQLDIFTAR